VSKVSGDGEVSRCNSLSFYIRHLSLIACFRGESMTIGK
jgi:hypothetical protein